MGKLSRYMPLIMAFISSARTSHHFYRSLKEKSARLFNSSPTPSPWRAGRFLEEIGISQKFESNFKIKVLLKISPVPH